MKAVKSTIIIMIIFCTLLFTAGCKIGNTNFVFRLDSKKSEVFKINGESCTLDEAMVFLTNYQNLYSKMYDLDLWEHDFGENSLEEYVKDLTVSRLAQIKSMKFLAQQENVSLTDEEVEKTKLAAKEYYESLTNEEIQYMGVNQSTIESLYEQYGLANKLFHQLAMTSGVNDEVSEDEARIMEALQMIITSKSVAKEVKARLENGEDFALVANSIGKSNEADELEVEIGRGMWPKEVEEKAFSLNKDEIATYIQTEDAYYFVKCVNNYNQELTEANKVKIVEQKRKEAFDDVYEAFIQTLPSEYNEKLWSGIQIKQNDNITTSDFFEVYEQHCKW